MRLLVISDAHYGWSKSKAISVSRVINDVESDYEVDKIVFLGDTLDFWRGSIRSVINEFYDDVSVLDNDEVVFIRGNHDYIIDEVILGLKVYDYYSFDESIFTHGHSFDVICNLDLTLGEYCDACKLLCYTNNELGKLLSKLWSMYKVKFHGHKSSVVKFSRVLDFVNNLGCMMGRKYVFGHFHKYGVRDYCYALNAYCNGYYYWVDEGREVIEFKNGKRVNVIGW